MTRRSRLSLAVLLTTAALPAAALAQDDSGRLFHAPLDSSATATEATGIAPPLFVDNVSIIPDGAQAGALRAADNQILAWSAPGNLYAQRGTISFFWRSHQPIGRRQFVIFRAGYPDHTSWDMAFLRMDWNGHGYDVFVTDGSLARVRISVEAPTPDAEAWTHFAIAWDETQGLALYVNGRLAGKKDATAVLDNALYAFGPHSRIISGYQVQSAYDYQRGGDVDEVSTFDQMLGADAVAALARRETPVVPAAPARDMSEARWRDEWRLRYGFNRADDAPPYLAAPSTAVSTVVPTDVRDHKKRFWRGDDGLRETTWPGVYNRSRLEGRSDYFVLPDWDTYSAGGQALDVTLPDEPWNRIEVQGAADGTFSVGNRTIGRRPRGQERTSLQLDEARTGGAVRFQNRAQETPIREISFLNVRPGDAPEGTVSLSYVIRPNAAPAYTTLNDLESYIAGRFVADERQTVVALPAGAPETSRAQPQAGGMPLVHVLIPADFRAVEPGGPPARFDYGWANLRDGLDGIAIDIPALNVRPTHGGLFPLNIRVKDPLWPDRDLMDVNVSVKPGEARTIWLDTRDRILPEGRSLYLQMAGAGQDFNAAALDGARIRLVFKPREEAAVQHVADRLEQVKGNLAFFVEEQPNNRLLPVYERFDRDITDLLRVDPDNQTARVYWNEQNGGQPYPAFAQTDPAPGVPLWAHRQIEDLKQVRHFINFWIDERQIEDGEFGGGLSDDSDLLNQWPPLVLMGVDSGKVTHSVGAAMDAIYRSGMITDGLNTIRADELHSYEEGINTVAQYAQLNWGSPRAVEQLMATARRYGDITEVNPAGHRHFVSNSYAHDDMWREGPWQRQRGNNFLMFHPGILLVQWNGSPAARDMILSTTDGYLAHAKPATGGGATLPAQIDWPSDGEFTPSGVSGGAGGAGLGGSTSVFWAAYRWTGDDKYLQPLLNGAPRSLTALNADVTSILGRRDEWGPGFIQQAGASDPYRLSNTGGAGSPLAMARFGAWQATGDKRYLETIYGEEIRSASQRMPIMTDGHLWSDRVQIPSEMLQRSRLGGIAARRGQIYPGNVVSWAFEGEDNGESVAILVPEATQTRFKVIVFNVTDHPVRAAMTGWDVTAGRWTVAGGVDADGDDTADAPSTRTIDFGPNASESLTFAPGVATVLTFELAEAGQPVSTRPDVGLDPQDVAGSGRDLRVTIHGLGAVDSPAGEVIVEDASGREVVRGAFPALAAPLDLQPKTTTVALRLPSGVSRQGLRVRLALAGDPLEIARTNNQVVLP
ncbi:LamG-like jellyroll fold domain-containing protein [Brevundimonas sp. NPDC092305]|uniref:LamG-like jellyroll fold domain-containing protein n=1 Tax=Brevundimonas sp. NPDC092305 TaxID=3363957 RepID=UPI0037FB627E